MATSFWPLEKTAQSKRVQGSVFKIQFVPALLMLFDEFAVALAEINRKSIGEYSTMLSLMKVHGFRALRTTSGLNENWIIPLAITKDQYHNLFTPRLAFKSRSRGADRPLEWDDIHADRDTKGFDEFCFDYLEYATRPRVEAAAQ